MSFFILSFFLSFFLSISSHARTSALRIADVGSSRCARFSFLFPTFLFPPFPPFFPFSFSPSHARKQMCEVCLPFPHLFPLFFITRTHPGTTHHVFPLTPPFLMNMQTGNVRVSGTRSRRRARRSPPPSPSHTHAHRRYISLL